MDACALFPVPFSFTNTCLSLATMVGGMRVMFGTGVGERTKIFRTLLSFAYTTDVVWARGARTCTVKATSRPKTAGDFDSIKLD